MDTLVAIRQSSTLLLLAAFLGCSGSHETAAGSGGTSSVSASTGSGGASSSGSASASSSSGAPHVVTPCNALPQAGTWEDVTPPAVKSQLPGPGNCTFGTNSFVVDPSDPATVYLGTCQMGVWKTTDCAATWTHVNTGQGGDQLDSGRQWNFVIDPLDPQVLYAASGYNAKGVSGEFKSTDGGVSWTAIWPPQDPTLASVVQYNFVAGLAMDPGDHQHLLLTFHAVCNPPHHSACMAESHDAGGTWKIVEGDASWTGGEGQGAWFLDKGQTFLWGAETNGLWRTTDGGATWKQVADSNSIGHAKGQLHRTSDGRYFLGGSNGMLFSPDGVSWSLVKGSPQTEIGLVSDGKTMYASVGFPWNPGQGPPPYKPFYTSSEADGMTWTQMGSPLLSNGGELHFDSDHHILYSSNLDAGFYRVVVQ
jgi:hypothetical protein